MGIKGTGTRERNFDINGGVMIRRKDINREKSDNIPSSP